MTPSEFAQVKRPAAPPCQLDALHVLTTLIDRTECTLRGAPRFARLEPCSYRLDDRMEDKIADRETPEELKFCRHCLALDPVTKSERKVRIAHCEKCGRQIELSGVPAAVRILRRLLDVKLSRRKVVTGAISGISAIGAAVYLTRDVLLESIAIERASRSDVLIRQPRLRDIEALFVQVMGLAAPDQALSLGRDTYPSRTGYHVDNLAAGMSLGGALGLFDPIEQIVKDRPFDAPPDGDLILIGGPNSTPWTSIAWEFEGPDDHSLRRRSDPIIPLMYYGISDSAGLERVGWDMQNQGPRASYNWPFVCTDPSRPWRLLTPEYGPDTVTVDRGGEVEVVPVLRTNYLLVTRLPNFLAPNFEQIVASSPPEDWPHLTVFEGNHGVGTRGVELLIAVEGLRPLELLSGRLEGAPTFQAVFLLGDIQRAAGGFHKPYSIELLDAAPLRLKDSVYLAAHRYASRRLAGPLTD